MTESTYIENLKAMKLENDLFIFNWCVIKPLLDAGVLKDPINYKIHMVEGYRNFVSTITSLGPNNEMNLWRIRDKNSPTVKETDKILEQLTKTNKAISESSMEHELSEVAKELQEKASQLEEWRATKEGISSHKYKDGLLIITYVFIKYWKAATKTEEPITAYTKGQTYNEHLDAGITKGKIGSLEYINSKDNPGGACIQRCLETYYGLKFNVQEMENLLKKVNKEITDDIELKKAIDTLYPTGVPLEPVK